MDELLIHRLYEPNELDEDSFFQLDGCELFVRTRPGFMDDDPELRDLCGAQFLVKVESVSGDFTDPFLVVKHLLNGETFLVNLDEINDFSIMHKPKRST